MTTQSQATIKGITYNILAETKLDGENNQNGWYISLVILKRPKGHKEFMGMRDINGNIDEAF